MGSTIKVKIVVPGINQLLNRTLSYLKVLLIIKVFIFNIFIFRYYVNSHKLHTLILIYAYRKFGKYQDV